MNTFGPARCAIGSRSVLREGRQRMEAQACDRSD